MIMSVKDDATWHVALDVDHKEKRIEVIVSLRDKLHQKRWEKTFPANRFGQAVDFYDLLCMATDRMGDGCDLPEDIFEDELARPSDKLYKISADGGATWTTQWLRPDEAEAELDLGHMLALSDEYFTRHNKETCSQQQNTTAKPKYYRYQLSLDGEDQHIGFIVGLKDLSPDVTEEQQMDLLKHLDAELSFPAFYESHKEDCPYLRSYFTEAGKQFFQKDIDALIQTYQDHGLFDVEEVVVEEDQVNIVYRDKYQILILESKGKGEGTHPQ